MARNKLVTPGWLLAAVIFVVVVTADLLQIVRPSGIAAASCVPGLFAGAPSSGDLLAAHESEIEEQAIINGLPPELLAAVIINHQGGMSAWRRFTDCFGSALGANLSLGLAQVRLSTAALVDGETLASLSPRRFRRLRKDLLTDERNIAYQAREMRALLEREHRFPGLGPDELIREPFVMALLITEYRTGRSAAASIDSRLDANAFSALRILRRDMLQRFRRKPDEVAAIRKAIGEYLTYIYCDSGIFNSGVCEEWIQQDGNTTIE